MDTAGEKEGSDSYTGLGSDSLSYLQEDSPGLLHGIGRVLQESPVQARDHDNQPGMLRPMIPHNGWVNGVWATNTV